MKSEFSSCISVRSSPLEVMNFLNEMAGEFPMAISFASGRPSESFFDIENWLGEIPNFARHFANQRQLSFSTAMNLLAQYGRTNGIINDLIVKQVHNDEGINCTDRQILVTSGCQEAIDLCVRNLCKDESDVLLVRSPTYIGITGVAYLNGIEIAPIANCIGDDIVQGLRRTVGEIRCRGKRPRALYLIPDFDNPTGTVLPYKTREEILGFCAEEKIAVLEDNPYGMFRYEGDRIPPMYVLDKHGCVIYLGTYSKTICPSLRVGFAIIPEKFLSGFADSAQLMEQLSQAKSFITVNTSQITQAIVGGVLLAENCSLARKINPSVDFYRRNRNAMMESLQSNFSEYDGRISWNMPHGGFFCIVSLPFRFTIQETKICAREFGVLVMPLYFFSFDNAQDCCVRLSFANVTPQIIQDGILRFSRFIASRIDAGRIK